MPEFENRSPYRCSVQRDFLSLGVSITFGLVYGGSEVRIMRFGEDGAQQWHQQDSGLVIDKPTFRIDEEFARALYEQLGQYFQGQPDQTSSRADYLAERKAHEVAEQRLYDLAVRSIDAFEAGL